MQGGAVKCLYDMTIGEDSEEEMPGRDLDAGRLSTLLTSLPVLTSIEWLHLRADLHRRPTEAAIRAFLAGVARAIGRCLRLQYLGLHIVLADELEGR